MSDRAESGTQGMSDITWTNDTRRLCDLIPWERNPRQIREAEAERLKESREEFNQPQVVVIGPDDDLYDGHQRLFTWLDEWGPDLEVAVRVSSRPLTEQERQKLTILLHTGAHGDWDWDALANWGLEEELLDWGFSEVELGVWAGEIPEFQEFDESIADDVEMIECPECGHRFPK